MITRTEDVEQEPVSRFTRHAPVIARVKDKI